MGLKGPVASVGTNWSVYIYEYIKESSWYKIKTSQYPLLSIWSRPRHPLSQNHLDD